MSDARIEPLTRGRAGAPEASADALRRRLDAGLADMGLALDAGARDRLVAYVLLLERWNRAYNLTGVRDPMEMIPRHVLDSLSALPHVRGARGLDVGSGAGLPGLVLAVARPDMDWVLLDSNAKKCRFLGHARRALGVDNVQVTRSRVEEFHPGERFSTIISRALSSLADFIAGTRHLLASGGCLVAMKGRNPVPELAAAGEWGERAEVVPVTVPGLADGERHLVIVTRAGESN